MSRIKKIDGISRGGERFKLSSREQFEICPVCNQKVKVAGPMHGMWVIQPHSPRVITRGNELCVGVNTKIPASH